MPSRQSSAPGLNPDDFDQAAAPEALEALDSELLVWEETPASEPLFLEVASHSPPSAGKKNWSTRARASAAEAAIQADDQAGLLRALQAGQDPDARSVGGASLASMACEWGRDGCLDLLLGAGADPDSIDRPGSHCPSVAAKHGHEACLRTLAKHGANLHRRSVSGSTAMEAACSEGHEACIGALIELGCHPDEAGRDGATLLMRAAMDNQERSAMALAAFGARLDARDASGRAAAELARAHGHDGLAAWLDGLAQSRSQRVELAAAAAEAPPAEQGPKPVGRPRI